jgi:hypothetical protein
MPPWTTEETDACFTVRDAAGRRWPTCTSRRSPDDGRRPTCSPATRRGVGSELRQAAGAAAQAARFESQNVGRHEPFHIGAVSGRSRGGLSTGGDGVGLPTGVLCFTAAFFIVLAMDFSRRAAVGFSSGANATKTGDGGCDANTTMLVTPNNRMREGMTHMRANWLHLSSR